jgi:hypothetical protein
LGNVGVEKTRCDDEETKEMKIGRDMAKRTSIVLDVIDFGRDPTTRKIKQL